MASYGTITVTAKWKSEEGDGSPCAGCGDDCYLEMWRLWFTMQRSYEWKPLDVVLCGSCGEAVMQTK